MTTSHLITKEHAHAGYAADHEPVLTVDPGTGERITFETDDAAYAQMEQLRDLAKVTATINPVTGPVHVRGAEPGDALAVTIHDIEMAEHGWSVYIPGAGALAGPMGEEWYVRRVPVRDGVVQLTDTVSCAAAPMIGCIGVAPADGVMSTVMPSYPTGGNMDLTDARPGATVYLPVAVPGANLAIGDLHAVMSRGRAPSSPSRSPGAPPSASTCSRASTCAHRGSTPVRSSCASASETRCRTRSTTPTRTSSRCSPTSTATAATTPTRS